MKYLLILTLFVSCTAPRLALKSTHQDEPFRIETNKTYDEAWTSVVDFFADSGVGIKIIDKESGLISAESSSFRSSYTRENSNGTPIDDRAFIVIGNLRNGFGGKIEPSQISGEWNIRVKELGDNTQISINLHNIDCYYDQPATSYTRAKVVTIPAASTGVFERSLSEKFK